MAGKKHYHVEIRRNGAVYGTFGPYAKRSDALADAGSLGAPGVKVAIVSGSGSSCPSCPGKAPAKRRKNTSKRNTSGKWIQKATAGSKEGVFTAQAKRAGYPSALAFARAIMKRWKAGHKSVENKKTGKMQRVTVTTMRRANLALNMQKRKAPAKRRNTSKAANRRKSKPTSYNLPPPLARR